MRNIFRKIFSHGEMDCAEVRKSSSDYLAEDLPPQKLAAVQAHLQKCGPCRAFVETLSSTISLLARIPRVSPPASFKQSIVERTRQEERG
ncbi:MAG: anti-sigma factor family protein [Dehalococcoidia bacterium]